jgi:hypothetical protein
MESNWGGRAWLPHVLSFQAFSGAVEMFQATHGGKCKAPEGLALEAAYGPLHKVL